MPETRPIWPDRAMRDYLATIAEVDDDLALRYLVEQWDAAPADAEEAVRKTIANWHLRYQRPSEHLRYQRPSEHTSVQRSVLAALGQPEGADE